MSALGGLIVVLAAWLGGRALLPSRTALPRCGWEEQGIAYLLGSATLVLAAMAATWAGLPFTAVTAGAMLALSAFAGGWRPLRDRPEPLAARAPEGRPFP
ncbi:MAG: hypothetical protein H8E31_16385, partial [Planctomycetes bacterium]|nr:hypothetical protein [Planctomycetota bacterium]